MAKETISKYKDISITIIKSEKREKKENEQNLRDLRDIIICIMGIPGEEREKVAERICEKAMSDDVPYFMKKKNKNKNKNH